MSMNTVLEVADVEKYYGNKGGLTKALDKISFAVEEGEFVGIMGASGSGKTTLLNCISTIDRVTSGKIIVEDKDITRLRGNHLNKFRREALGFIFQDFNLLDTLTAYENIALALTIQRVKPDLIQKRVEAMAEQLGISSVLSKPPCPHTWHHHVSFMVVPSVRAWRFRKGGFRDSGKQDQRSGRGHERGAGYQNDHRRGSYLCCLGRCSGIRSGLIAPLLYL